MCEGASAISETVAAASSSNLKGETPHDQLNRLISMHLFLAMLAAPLTSQHKDHPLASQHKDHPLRQLLSHRQLMSQAQCDAAYSSIAAAATTDSACKQTAGMMPTMAAQILPPDCDADMSAFSTVNNCNQLKAAWDELCFSCLLYTSPSPRDA